MIKMQTRARLLGLVAVVAVVMSPATAPSAVADASVNPISGVTLSADTSVFPVLDGYRDSLGITADIAAASGERRVRASVTIALGKRVVHTWNLSSTGTQNLIWDGRVGGKIVAGTYTITVRAADDDGTQYSASRTATVSAKKRVKVTLTHTQWGSAHWNCNDDKWVEGAQAQLKYIQFICKPGYRSDGYGPINITARGRVSEGPVTYYGMPWISAPTQIRKGSYGPLTMKVTGRFIQSGSGSNQFYVCEVEPCAPNADARTFSGSGTFTTTGTLPVAPRQEPSWMVIVQPGHDVKMVSFTVTYTYYVLT